MNKEKEEFENLAAKIKSETERIVDKYYNRIVIANQYQLMRSGEKLFSPEHKKIQQSKQPVEVSYVSWVNSQWASCGKLYEVDEEATEEWQSKLKEHKETLHEKDVLERQAGQALIGALKSVKANLKEEAENTKNNNRKK